MSILRVWRGRFFVLAVPLVLLLAAACSGGLESGTGPTPTATTDQVLTAPTSVPTSTPAAATTTPTPTSTTAATPTPAPTITPTVTATAAATNTATATATATSTTTTSASTRVACDTLKDIQSFRFTMAIQIQSEALAEQLANSLSGQSGSQGTPDQFTQALVELLKNLKIDGAYVRPDRNQITMKVAGEDLSLITIGTQEWVKIGGLPWMASPTPAGSATLFSPSDLCDLATTDLALQGVDSQAETINGINTRHYHIDHATLAALARALGTEQELNDLPQTFTMDLWLAEDGQWPVRINIAATDKDEQGRDVQITMSLEMRDINSSDIKIEPPPT